MTALPARNVKIALRLVARGDRKALGCAECAVLHPRHVVIPWQLERWHVEKAREERRQRPGERMAYAHRVMSAPCAARKLTAAGRKVDYGGIRLRQQKLAPVSILGRESPGRSRRHEFPQRLLKMIGRRCVLLHAKPAQDDLPHGVLGLIAVLAHQSIADRVDARTRIPICDPAPELHALRMIVQGSSIEELQDESAPTGKEDGSIIKLHAQHVRRCRSAGQGRQVVTDLMRARAEIVARADERLIAYMLYWRGETFYTSNEIYEGPTEERTVFDQEGADDRLKDWIAHHRGRRVFFLYERHQQGRVRDDLPAETRASFQVVDERNNKFSLAQADL